MTGRSTEDQRRTPLVDALQKMQGRVSFHMPGHRQSPIFDEPGTSCFHLLDTTELEGSGDLASPSAHVLEAYQLAAAFFGSGETWFIPSGTTSSLFIMLASLLEEGDQLILPRAVHMAVVHAVALLGLEPCFVTGPDRRSFPDGQPDARAFIESIKQYPEAKACLVTRPDYFGRVMDLSPVAHEAGRAGMALLVDEAHGAHWAAAPDLMPPTALSQGADMTCQSAHKTLSALTPASLLHVSRKAMSDGLVDRNRLAGMVKVFQTSSPSFLIAASIDAARAQAASDGREALARLIRLNQELCDRLPPSFERVLPPGADPSRLVIDFSKTGRGRLDLIAHLDEAGIDAELIDLTRAVFIPGLDQDEEDYDRLHQALVSLPPERDHARKKARLNKNRALLTERDAFLSAPASFVQSPRQALLGHKREKGLAKEVIAPYPPGVPLIWPGEPMTAAHDFHLRALRSEGVTVRGFSSPSY